MKRIPLRYDETLHIYSKICYRNNIWSDQYLLQGLQFIADTKDSNVTARPNGVKENSFDKCNSEKLQVRTTRLHRSFPVGISLAQDLMGCDI